MSEEKQKSSESSSPEPLERQSQPLSSGKDITSPHDELTMEYDEKAAEKEEKTVTVATLVAPDTSKESYEDASDRSTENLSANAADDKSVAIALPESGSSKNPVATEPNYDSSCTAPRNTDPDRASALSSSAEDAGATALRSEDGAKQQGLEDTQLVDRIKGVIYGNCIGDAIGLLTEFMTKAEAKEYYGRSRLVSVFRKKGLEYNQKHEDYHRSRWVVGDWTDDSDQMILILITLVKNNSQFDKRYFAKRLKDWVHNGFPELEDTCGCGLGRTTASVLSHVRFLTDPHQAAQDVWEGSGRFLAPNGGVMRTSILGTMEFSDLKKVIENTRSACKVTHADPRCVASCVAVTVAIALMLQGKYLMNSGEYDVEGIMNVAHGYAQEEIEDGAHKKELTDHMFADSLDHLKLDESRVIGYTLKCLGAGFWAFRQKDFREAIEKITMEAGDADTNCAVAGALLGCKVGFSKLPASWVTGLAHRGWLDRHVESYLALLDLRCPVQGRL